MAWECLRFLGLIGFIDFGHFMPMKTKFNEAQRDYVNLIKGPKLKLKKIEWIGFVLSRKVLSKKNEI